MAVEEGGVGRCWMFRLVDEEGRLVEESDVRTLCEAGDRWVFIDWENPGRVWHGRTPESAVLAYERSALEKRAGSVEERRRRECARWLEDLESAKRAGALEEAERLEGFYRRCVGRLEEEVEELARLERLVESLRKGKVKAALAD